MDSNENKPCIFCGQDATFNNSQYAEVNEYCCRQCGNYLVAFWVEEELQKDTGDLGFRIACVLHEKRLRNPNAKFGVFELDDYAELPEDHELRNKVSVFKLENLLAEFPKATEIIDRVLLNLSKLPTTYPMENVEVEQSLFPFLFFGQGEAPYNAYGYIKDMGYIKEFSFTSSGVIFSLSPDGWDHIEELQQANRESRQGFVAMWMDPEMDDIYKNGIKPAIEADKKYDCLRVDEKPHNDKICDRIIAEIRKSRFVVADFSAGRCQMCDECENKNDCKDQVRPRGGVYFEAGFALGLGIPVIWIVRDDQKDQMHFDTRQYSHIIYRDAKDLRIQLTNRIRATIS